MRLREKLHIGYKVVRARLSNNRVPLLVGWSVTNRCNLSCVYCSRWSSEVEELKTSDIFSIIDELKVLGTKMISFTGGEPLLRDDIGDIISYTDKSKIYANINTNGTLFAEKINELDSLRSVKFSLDGPEDVNDFIRGKGTFKKVFEGIKAAQAKDMSVSIVTALSKYNLGCIDYLVKFAEDLGIGILFQPLALTLLYSNTINIHIPDARRYGGAVDRLIGHKSNNRPILNTKEELRYLKNWPKGKKIICHARNISCRIETDGYLYHCGRRQDKTAALNCLGGGVKKAFDSLACVSCEHCWCALRLKANYIASLNPRSIFSVFKKL